MEFEDFKHEIDTRGGYLFELNGEEAKDTSDFEAELHIINDCLPGQSR
jgi:hypothetical protein